MEQLSLNTPGTRSQLRGDMKKREVKASELSKLLWVKDGPRNEHEKVAIRREKGALQYPKQNRTNNTEQELNEK